MKTIHLTRGLIAQVDDEDYEWIAARKWYASLQGKMKKPYAIRWVQGENGKRRKLWMHREIMKPLPEMVVHHIDGNGLNNQRANLEIIPYAENARHAYYKMKAKEEPCL